MKNKIFAKRVLLFLLVIFMISCKSEPKAPKPKPVVKDEPVKVEQGTLNIKSVTWLIEELDPSIWNGAPKAESKMFISFYISYAGTFDTSLISSILIESPIDMWNLNAAQAEKIIEIQDENKIAIVKRLQCGDGLGAVPLGSWKFSLTPTNGNKYEQEMNIDGFAGGAEVKVDDEEPLVAIESKDETFSVKTIVPKATNKNQISALTMPVIKSVSKDEDSIEIYFTANDERIKNGYFWFDVPGEKYYKDSGSMIDASGNPVNGCREFYTNGKTSRYILRKDADNAEWFDKITACFFVVSDTNRVSSPWEERNRTVSAKAIVE